MTTCTRCARANDYVSTFRQAQANGSLDEMFAIYPDVVEKTNTELALEHLLCDADSGCECEHNQYVSSSP